VSVETLSDSRLKRRRRCVGAERILLSLAFGARALPTREGVSIPPRVWGEGGGKEVHSLAFEARVGLAAKRNSYALALGARERGRRSVATSSCWSGDPLQLAFV